MLNVGIAGIGFMGWIHWLAYQQIDDVRVVAICDQDPLRLSGDWTGIQGNFGPRGEWVDLAGIETYQNLESFCRADFDLVDICLPPSWHRPAIELAASAGKHVFCEKPLCLTVEDCDSAVNACRTANRMLMVGHVLPFFPEYRVARQVIDSGQHGRLVNAWFKRVIADPAWLSDYYVADKIGGPLMDLHIHDAHFLRLIGGMPNRVYARGRLYQDVVKFCYSIFGYDDQDFCASSSSGTIDQAGRGFNHAFEIQLEQATLQFEYAALASGDELMPLKLLAANGDVDLLDCGTTDPIAAFVDELREMVRSAQAGIPSSILSGELARDAVRVCDAETHSVKSGRVVEIT